MMVLLCLLFNLSAEAQVAIGPRVGVGFFQRTDDNEDPEPVDRVGLNLGAAVNFGVNNFFSLVGEVGFQQKGWRQGFDNANNEFKVNYLELDLLAKIKVGNRFGAYGLLGPYASVGMGGTITTELFGEEDEMDLDFDDLGLNRTDLGIIVGLGGFIAVDDMQFYLDARYSGGFINLDDTEVLDTKNAGIILSAGAFFPLN